METTTAPRHREMLSARQVQARLLPRNPPRLRSLEVAGRRLPGRAVGGDFYDFLEPDPGRLALVLGDISGKGIPAALMMATLQASLRSHYALSAIDLGHRIECLNRMFFDCTAAEHYASLFVGEYDDATGLLRYANCGQVPPLLVHEDRTVERLRPTATVLGMFEHWAGSIAEVSLGRGDTLVLTTDGIVEATDSSGEEFGEARLLSTVMSHRELPPRPLIRAIADVARAFSAGRPVDDQTLVVARVRTDLTAPASETDAEPDQNTDDGAR